jgi:hypothetical protein
VGTMQNVSLELEWKALGFCFQVQVTSDIKWCESCRLKLNDQI